MVILNNISLVAFHSKCTFDVKKTQHKYTNIIKCQIFSFINEISTSLLGDITLTFSAGNAFIRMFTIYTVVTY